MKSSSAPQLKAHAIKTPIFQIGENLETFLATHLEDQLFEGAIVAITSKIISLAEGQLVPKSEISKRDLIRKESDHFICETPHGVSLTIKAGLLIPSAGIDESNSPNGDYILYPENPFLSAQRIHDFLKLKFQIKNLGILLTDSHTHALRKGVTGISLAHWGFKATRSMVGEADLFGRAIQMTSVNLVDALSVTAVLLMGEVAETCPLAILNYPGLVYTNHSSAEEIAIPLEEDLYGPLLKGV